MRVLALGLILLASVRAEETSAPIQKVVEMLSKISSEVTAESEKEAAQFKEFADFCSKSLDEKTYQIGRSQKKLETLSATAGVLDADLQALEGDVSLATEEVQKLETELKKTRDDRTAEVATYEAQVKEVDGSISAVERAIESLKASKDGVASKASLVQIEEALSSNQKDTLAAFLDAPGDAKSYAYKSSDVTGMLQDLLRTFKENRHSLDMVEAESKGSFQKKELNLQMSLKYAQEELDGKKGSQSEKKAKKAVTEGELTSEVAAKGADEAFVTSLTSECTEKAELSEQRKVARKAELDALKQAIDGLGGQAKASKPSLLQVSSKARAASVSMQSTRHGARASIAAKAWISSILNNIQDSFEVKQTKASFLQQRSRSPESSILDDLVNKLQADGRLSAGVALAVFKAEKANNPDNFVEVRKMIQELITNLESAASSDGKEHEFCKAETEKVTTTRDEYSTHIESLSAKIASANAEQSKLTNQVTDLRKTIGDLNFKLAEATAMRAEEKASNNVSLAEAKEGKAAVDYAVTALNGFYKGSSFLQQPKVPAKGYTGSEKSKGVIGLLEALATDFQGDIDRIPKEEEEAEKKFQEFKTASETDVAAKGDEVKQAVETLAQLKQSFLQFQDDQSTAQKSLDLTQKQLKELQAMCNAKESPEEKAKKREQEIQSLQETLSMIESLSKQSA